MNHDIEKALDNLEKRAQDIQHYIKIIRKLNSVKVCDEKEFQRQFHYFYKVRRNAEWRKVFFEIFERKKKKNCSYKEIITETLSFHQEEGLVQNEFTDRDELRCFLLAVSGIYRIQ